MTQQNFRADSFVEGLFGKAAVRVATTGPITLSGEQIIDLVPLVVGDRVLVKDQADPIENGIYVVQTSAWTRAGDFDGNRDVVGGSMVMVYNPSPAGFILYTVDGNGQRLEPNVDAMNFSVFLDPLVTGADTLQSVTAIGNTTDQGIIITAGNLVMQGGIQMRLEDGSTLFIEDASETHSVVAEVNLTTMAPAPAVVFAATAAVEVYSFDNAINIDGGNLHLPGTGRLAFYRYGDAISGSLSQDGSQNIRLTALGEFEISVADNVNFRGNPIKDFTILHQSISSVSGVVTWDYEAGQSADITLDENVTSLVFSNLPSTDLLQIDLEVNQDGATPFTFAWPASVEFAGGTEPDFSTLGSRHLCHLRSRDAGTTWLLTHAAEFS